MKTIIIISFVVSVALLIGGSVVRYFRSRDENSYSVSNDIGKNELVNLYNENEYVKAAVMIAGLYILFTAFFFMEGGVSAVVSFYKHHGIIPLLIGLTVYGVGGMIKTREFIDHYTGAWIKNCAISVASSGLFVFHYLHLWWKGY